MKTIAPPGHDDSFLLRIRRGGKQNRWRWVLQNIRMGEQTGFREMDALMRDLDVMTYGENADEISRLAELPRARSTRAREDRCGGYDDIC